MVPPVSVMEDFGPADTYSRASFASINAPMKRTLPAFRIASIVTSAIGVILNESPDVKTMWSILECAVANFRTVLRLGSKDSG